MTPFSVVPKKRFCNDMLFSFHLTSKDSVQRVACRVQVHPYSHCCAVAGTQCSYAKFFA